MRTAISTVPPLSGLSGAFIVILLCSAILSDIAVAAAAPANPRPNILWIVSEDINPQLGCYGDPNAITPALDRLAAKGLRYTRCWSTAPVCAPARTALISGEYPCSTGGEHMRSEVRMPSFMRMYPQLLAAKGYYCVNVAKEDYNLAKPGKVWAESSPRAHYRNRAAGQPFFAVFNIEITHESQIRKRPHTLQHDPAKMRLPAYHPDTPAVRHDWAQYYDNITATDQVVSNRLAELEREGLAEDTIVFFYGDNGSGMPRSKRCPYNSGLNVPLIIYVPEKLKALAPPDYGAGGASDRLVGFVDFAPTLLSLAGIEPPAWMQGLAFMGPHATPPPRYIHGLRGRMDERYDLVRSVRNDRFIYIRNYMPHLIYGQYIEYMFQTPTTRAWKELYDQGKLRPPQTFFWEPKPPEELYDLNADPDEVHNLVASSRHSAILEELRRAQRDQALKVRDVGFLPEAEMHRRAAGTTIYEMGHDPARYPLEDVLAMADLASLLEAGAVPRLKAGLNNPDSAVRYWAALGLLMRGDSAVKQSLPELRRALDDSSPSVRIVAAQACGQFGEGADLKRALDILKDLVQPEKSGAYAAIHALNVVAALGPKAAPLSDTIRSMNTKDPNAPDRANSYVPRLATDLTGQAAPPAAPKKGRAKRPAR
ncbi:MAG TPA: sulfatase-like hydrolase/transferase [Verrucomicrobiae bacterium]